MTSQDRRALTNELLARIDAVTTGHELQHSMESTGCERIPDPDDPDPDPWRPVNFQSFGDESVRGIVFSVMDRLDLPPEVVLGEGRGWRGYEPAGLILDEGEERFAFPNTVAEAIRSGRRAVIESLSEGAEGRLFVRGHFKDPE